MEPHTETTVVSATYLQELHHRAALLTRDNQELIHKMQEQDRVIEEMNAKDIEREKRDIEQDRAIQELHARDDEREQNNKVMGNQLKVLIDVVAAMQDKVGVVPPPPRVAVPPPADTVPPADVDTAKKEVDYYVDTTRKNVIVHDARNLNISGIRITLTKPIMKKKLYPAYDRLYKANHLLNGRFM